MKYCEYLKNQMKDSKFERLVAQERLIAQVQEGISQLMEERNVSKAELARRLGKTRGFVTQLLDSGRNLTLRTIADVYTALGQQPAILVKEKAETTSRQEGTTQVSRERLGQIWKTTEFDMEYNPIGGLDPGLLEVCALARHSQRSTWYTHEEQ